MFIAQKMTPENFASFVGQPFDPFASATVLVQDGGTKIWPKGRRTIYMAVKLIDEWAVIDENGKIKLTGRSIGELVRAHSDGYTFFYIEIK